MSKKKPDNIVWTEEDGYNASLLPYATSVSAPAIKTEDIDLWKQRGANKVNHQLKTKYEELKAEYQNLVEELRWNDLIYNARFGYEPVMGETYHLYYDKVGEVFLSLIGPTEWNKPFIGSFKLDSSNKWIKVG